MKCKQSFDTGITYDCTSDAPHVEAPAELMSCPDRTAAKCRNASGAVQWAFLCDGDPVRIDDWDERNCPESREGFRCSADQSVPWPAVCDGRSDCANATDETICATED